MRRSRRRCLPKSFGRDMYSGVLPQRHSRVKGGGRGGRRLSGQKCTRRNPKPEDRWQRIDTTIVEEDLSRILLLGEDGTGPLQNKNFSPSSEMAIPAGIEIPLACLDVTPMEGMLLDSTPTTIEETYVSAFRLKFFWPSWNDFLSQLSWVTTYAQSFVY